MDQLQEKKLFLRRTDYLASNGQEIFLEFVDSQDRIYGLLRLRISLSPIISLLQNGGLIRELHVFGQSLKLLASTPGVTHESIRTTPGVERTASGIQHHGLGKKLLAKAEGIVKKEFKLNKVAVISGVGVRKYYRNLGYELKNEYMVKSF